MPEIRMSLQDYINLVLDGPTQSQRLDAMTIRDGIGRSARKGGVVTEGRVRKPKRKGTPDPKMAKALKKANAIGRTKSGKLRKGYTQARIMKKAHQLRRKM